MDGAGDLAELNIQTGTLRMWADAVVNADGTQDTVTAGNQQGLIGGPESNLNAIDIQVMTLAARSAEGIYLSEADGLTVDATEELEVQQVRFNSTRTSFHDLSLSDLETTTNGTIAIVSFTGNIAIQDGDGDNFGVIANGTGDILLLAQDLAGDIIVNANVFSDLGQIQFHAGSDIILSATIQTGRDGVSTPDIQFVAKTGFIDEASVGGEKTHVISGGLELTAAKYAHLHETTINTLQANVGSNGKLQTWQIVNANASQRGDDFLFTALGQERVDFAMNNGVLQSVDTSIPTSPNGPNSPQTPKIDDINFNPTNASNNPSRSEFDAVAERYRFADTYNSLYALFIKNTQSLDVISVTAGQSDAPNVYIETDGKQSDLTVVGTIATDSKNANEGGIVLVAGQQLNLEGQLLAKSTIHYQVVDIIGRSTVNNEDQFGDRQSYLKATIYNGGEGILPREDYTSTQFVIRSNSQSALSEDYRTHVYQRVVMQFGYPGEAGFVAFVGYADGNVQQFDVNGEVGVREVDRSELDLNDQSSIPATFGNNATVFTRAISFTNNFLDSNQNLPTVAVIRRSDDFFLFENASADNLQDIVDLTVEFQDVKDVRALGAQGATELPVDPAPPAIAFQVGQPIEQLLQRPTDLIAPEVEFVAPTSGEVEVAFYRVSYTDKNVNGQPEQDELPGPAEVKGMPTVSEEEAEQLANNSDEDLKKRRVKLEKFKTSSEGSPTAEEIDRLKQQLLDDPEQPTGAYAIIEEQVDGKEVVLDIFSVRDFEPLPAKDQPLIQEERSDSQVEPPAVQATPAPTDNSSNDLPQSHAD